MLTSDQKGAIAEEAIVLAALELGVAVARPVADQRYDLIFDLEPRFVRVQCKWACRYGDVVVVRCYRARRNGSGLVRRVYERSEVDAFAAYCAELRRCYFLPFEVVPPGGTLQLRLSPPLNNQRLGVHWAKNFELAATLGADQGAVAQLGERRAGSA